MTTLEAPTVVQANQAASPARSTKPLGLTERLAVASGRRPKRTLAIWGLAILVALVLIATSLKGLTSNAYVVGGTQSKTAEALYGQVIGSRAAGRAATDVIVVSSATSTVADSSFRNYADRLISEVRTAPGISNVGTNLSPGSKLISSNQHAVLIALRAASDADIKPVVKTVQAASGRDGFSVAITGDHTVGNDFTTQSSKDLAHGELGFGLPVALIVLVLVFGALAAGLMPVLLGILSIIVGLGVASMFAREFTLSIFIVNMMTAMGLALGIDYSLFVISRFREERARGLDKEAAIRRMGATASRAVLFSGSTFVVALLGLFIVRTNVLRSLAAGAVIVGAVSVVAALTLLPAVLGLMGDRVNSLRLPIVGRNLGAISALGSPMWRSFIERVLRRPVISLLLAGGVLLLAAAPVLGLHIGQSGVSTLPNSLPSKLGYVAVQRFFPNQNPYPVEIVVDGSSHTDRVDLTKLQATLARDGMFGSGEIENASNGKLLALTVPITGAPVSNVDVAAVRNLRTTMIPTAFGGSRTAVYVGGTTAETADYFSAVSSPTPLVLCFVLGLSFVVLMLAFRSLVIAALSILLNLLSVGAAYGLLTLVFLHGIGADLFGFHQQAAIDAWVPLFLFAVLFALSMDYQVFLMSRIKERYDETGSTREAAISGVASTAKIITGAALIIIAVFAGFARGKLVMFQQMGFGVAVALFLDATLIRTVILPSALTLLGEHSWYLPTWLGWLPHIEVESPAEHSVDAASPAADLLS
jgi:RND superfamily putative drug exporter